jgi:hypothetical protein
MRLVRRLAILGWQVWLCAQEPGPPLWFEWPGPCPVWSEAEAPSPPEPVLRSEAEGPGPDRPCLPALPEAAPSAPHWHGPARAGGRNLVVEVRRLELTDACGCPRGTFR